AVYNGTTFTPSIQAQRPALGIVDNILYVPYGSLLDCGLWHGWLVGVPINNPRGVMVWATDALGGAIWGVGGVASDGNNPFVTTGNTYNTNGNWGGGEAVIRFQPGPIFSGSPSDYWAPLNWLDLDTWDFDLGGCGPLLVDVPGATPSHLVLALGKNTNGYLLNRDNLGTISYTAMMERPERLFTLVAVRTNSSQARIHIAPPVLQFGDTSTLLETIKCMPLPCQHLRLHRDLAQYHDIAQRRDHARFHRARSAHNKTIR